MTYEDTLNKLLEEHIDFNDHVDYVFYKMFNKNARVFSIQILDGENTISGAFEEKDYDERTPIDLRYFLEKIKDLFDNREFCTEEGVIYRLFYRTDILILQYSTQSKMAHLTVFSDSIDTIMPLLEYIKPYENDTKNNTTFTYITQSTRGFESVELEVNSNEDVSLDNYNDDIPYDKMLDFCDNSESGLMLFSGQAGTGKTSLIKKLMTNSRHNFILLSANTLSNIDTTEFMSYLIKNGEDNVLVLEDCDSLLKSRNLGENNAISTLLNLSDGILGDALKLKFICTYNTEESNIDKALLRKGRLKLKYIFKPLNKERAQKIADSLNYKIKIDKDITLADLYNIDTIDFSAKNTNKIGF